MARRAPPIVDMPLAEKCRRMRNRLHEMAWEQRNRLENGTMVVGMVTIRTDAASRARLKDLRAAAEANPKGEFDVLTVGGWRTLDAPAVIELDIAPTARLQTLFSAQRAHDAAIAALPDDEDVIRAYFETVTQGWPA